MQMRKITLFLVVQMLMISLVFAQVRTVIGKVTDEKGVAVPGASILEKGTKNGASSNDDGTFSLRVKNGATLVISALSFENKQVKAADIVNVQLVKTTENLTEVVVTALGQSQSKVKLGYSTATFNSETINKNAPIGILDGIAGKVAGADISNIGGPGSSTKVILRGYGAIAGADNQPLFVIDGVPLSNEQSQNVTKGTAGTDFGSGMNGINPNDIENITILKGTAASSLYGGLAKNGAVMITTKKGKAGKLKIEYDGSANFSRVGKLPEYQSEFGQGWAGLFVYGENGSWGPKLDGKDRLWGSIVDNSQLVKPFSAVKNNLRNFYTTGNEFNNTLALSGGNEITRFYFSYGNATSDGVIPTSSDYLQRNTFALRTNSNFDKFTINTSFNYTNQKLNVPNTGQNTASGGGVFESLIQIPVDVPITDFRDYKNKFFNTDNFFSPYLENPYYGLNENGNTQNSDRFFGNVDLGYKFTNHLSSELRVGGDFTNARTLGWNQPNNPAPGSWNAGGNTEQSVRKADVGSVSQASDYAGIINGDFLLKYNKDFGNDFTLDALVGVNYYQSSSKSENTTITNLVIPGFFNLSNTTLPPVAKDYSSKRRRMGVYAQATLGYKGQLFFTGNIRDDKSSTLPMAKNSIFYPGANLSWLASKTFDLNNTAITLLKFRTAYGKTGSDPNVYLTNATLVGATTIPLGFGSLTFPFNGVSGFGINNDIANPSLEPIFTTEFEFGAEIKLFKNRIGLDATYYDKKTKGQIFTVPIAPSTGYTGLVQNLGVVSNKGIELALTVVPFETKDFTWSFTYLYTKNINNVDNLTGGSPNPQISSAYDAQLHAVVGKTVASIYAPVPQLTPDGKTVVSSVTGEPTLNDTVLDSSYGQKQKFGYYGSGLYNYTMGLTNTFTYKSFQLGFSLDFRSGGVMYSETADQVLFVGNGIATTYNDRKPFIVPNSVNASTDINGKTVYTENKTFIGATAGGGSDGTTDYYYPTQNKGGAYLQRIFDRSFLKLRDVNLSYSLPQKWSTKIKASNATIGVYGRNFLLWTPKANVYVDPEATNLGNDLSGQLGEFASAPLTKSYGVILKIIF